MRRPLPFLIAATAIAACATATVDIRDPRSLPGNVPIVFGRILVVRDGQEIAWGGSSLARSLTSAGEFHLVILDEERSTVAGSDLSGDGTFFWSLHPGRYIITAFEWKEGLSAKGSSGRLMARFNVPAGVTAVYIGTLRIDIVDSQYKSRVEDERGKASELLSSRFPERTAEISTSLMGLEAPR